MRCGGSNGIPGIPESSEFSGARIALACGMLGAMLPFTLRSHFERVCYRIDALWWLSRNSPEFAHGIRPEFGPLNSVLTEFSSARITPACGTLGKVWPFTLFAEHPT